MGILLFWIRHKFGASRGAFERARARFIQPRGRPGGLLMDSRIQIWRGIVRGWLKRKCREL
jgi:hypothetical protein